MARRRSYLSKSGKNDPLGTFINNSIAKGQQQARQKEKEKDRAARQASRDYDRRKKREERERAKKRDRDERARLAENKKKRMQREKERVAQEKADTKMREKKGKLRARLEIELRNAKIPHSDTIINEIANQAYEADVSPAQLKKTFIDPNMKDYSKRSLCEVLELIVPVDASLQKELEILIDSCCSELPIDLDKVKSSSEWCSFINVCEDKNVAIEKDRVRVKCLDHMQDSKVLFSEDFEEIWEKAVSEDWSKEEILTSQMFLNFKKTKDSYKDDIANRIKAFM